jgi:hypothetical protein
MDAGAEANNRLNAQNRAALKYLSALLKSLRALKAKPKYENL